jgi:aspartyl-tRNA synthetase
MAFVEREDVLDVMEACVVGAFEAVGASRRAAVPAHRRTTTRCSLRLRQARPPLRLEIQDATEVTRGSEFGVFRRAVRALTRRAATFSRAELARLEEFAKEWGAKGLAYSSTRQISKFLSERELEAFGVAERIDRALRRRRGRRSRACSACCGCTSRASSTDRRPSTSSTGSPTSRSSSASEEYGGWTFMHHPFTATVPGDEERIEAIPGVRGQHYDLIWNGWELGSGSIRIHQAECSRRSSASWAWAKRSNGTSSASSSRRWRWARRRTAALRWASIRFIALLAREPDIRQVDGVPEDRERQRSAHRAPRRLTPTRRCASSASACSTHSPSSARYSPVLGPAP